MRKQSLVFDVMIRHNTCLGWKNTDIEHIKQKTKRDKLNICFKTRLFLNLVGVILLNRDPGQMGGLTLCTPVGRTHSLSYN